MSAATSKNDTTIALLLTPHELLSLFSIFTSLHVIRREKYIDYDRYPLSEHEIKTHFRQLPDAVQALLSRFHDDDIRFEIGQAKKRRAKERSGIPEDVFVLRSILRYLNEITLQLFRDAAQFKWYQRVKNPESGNFRISVCSVSTEQPALFFAVERNETGNLKLTAILRLQDQELDITLMRRYHFLLEYSDTYYLLKHEDWLTLYWLEQQQPERYAADPAALSQRILLKLEEKYTVQRNDLFNKTAIRCTPVNTIFLSEIGDSYLMLTPRWNYEGFLQEGAWKEYEETTRHGELYLVYRDHQAEDQFRTLLQSLHPNFAKQHNGYCYLSFADAKKKQWFLKTYHALLEMDVAIIGLDMLRHFRYSPFPVQTEMSILSQEKNILQLQLTVSFGKEKVALGELQKLLLDRQHSILLKDNSIGVLTEEWLVQYGPLLRHGKVKKDILSVPQWIMLGMQQGEAKQILQPVTPEAWRSRWIGWQDASSKIYDLPATVQAELRPYQHKGFEWLVLLSEIGAGACLADDMGLGKTLQTISFIAYRHELQPSGRSIIVCPASLIYNWYNELQRFTPHLQVYVYNGQQRSTEAFVNSGAAVLICSYGTLRSDTEQLDVLNWNVAVIDESHNIKNTAAQTTRAVYRLKAECRVALSGTPVMNNTFDLYSQLQYLLPDLFGSAEFFRKEYANPIDRDQDKEKIAALQQMTAPFILRRTKQQVAADLPEKTETILWCDMGEEQRLAYDEVRNSIRDSIFLDIKTSGLSRNKLNILQGIQKLRQVCGAPQLLKDLETPATQSVKTDVLMEELQRLKDNKALIFSQFKGMLHLIATELSARGIAYYHFDGDTPVTVRQDLVARFQEEGNDVRVFLISLKSGNAGLNLTAADYVFLVDPWWNTAIQQQAIDRTHRIGQTRPVFAYKMICRDTIEERIIALQQRKQQLSEELIGEEEGFVKDMTEDDIAYLFG